MPTLATGDETVHFPPHQLCPRRGDAASGGRTLFTTGNRSIACRACATDRGREHCAEGAGGAPSPTSMKHPDVHRDAASRVSLTAEATAPALRRVLSRVGE
jgi:hypothetical protein